MTVVGGDPLAQYIKAGDPALAGDQVAVHRTGTPGPTEFFGEFTAQGGDAGLGRTPFAAETDQPAGGAPGTGRPGFEDQPAGGIAHQGADVFRPRARRHDRASASAAAGRGGCRRRWV